MQQRSIKEDVALSGELPFQLICVITFAAGPRFFSIHVPATLSIASILHAVEVKERFPPYHGGQGKKSS
jgi:hypothetical protein